MVVLVAREPVVDDQQRALRQPLRKARDERFGGGVDFARVVDCCRKPKLREAAKCSIAQRPLLERELAGADDTAFVPAPRASHDDVDGERVEDLVHDHDTVDARRKRVDPVDARRVRRGPLANRRALAFPELR
jgi:hypothetical protein